MTKKGNRFNRPVAFNRSKTDDMKIYNYPAVRRNFSGFAKKAMLEKIERDEQKKLDRKLLKESKTVIPEPEQSYHPPKEPTYETPHEPTSAERLEQMRQQIEQKKTGNK